jgi:hypothetical protein
MQRTTIKWGIGGALFFPTVVLLLAFTMPSLAQAFHLLIFPALVAMDVVFPRNKEQYGIFIYVFMVLYLAILGFGIGALLGKVGKNSN